MPQLNIFAALRNAEEALTEALRRLLERENEDFDAFVIVNADDQKNYYAQFIRNSDSELYGEVVGNAALDRIFKLDSQQINKLTRLGWTERVADQFGDNFSQTWCDVDDEKLHRLVRLTLQTLEEVYGVNGGTELRIEIPFGEAFTDADVMQLRQKCREGYASVRMLSLEEEMQLRQKCGEGYAGREAEEEAIIEREVKRMREIVKKTKLKEEYVRLKAFLNGETQVTPTGRTREPIPDDVRIFVWRRDEGRCVKCGSQNNLEYDHIIPWNKGGSNTARNLQLLCEACNRQKSDSI